MKRILIPVDFKVQSLNTLKLAMASIDNYAVSVTLMFAEIPSDSITDLLFYSPARRIDSLTTVEFRKAMAILMNRYENTITEINIELLHSMSDSYFENFLEANRIDEIYIPEQYKLNICGRAFDPIPVIMRSGARVFPVKWEVNRQYSEVDMTDFLFGV